MHRIDNLDSGWVGADPDDDLDRQLLEEDDSFDRTQPHVLTTLGPVEPAALGATLAAEFVGRFAMLPAMDAPDGRHELLAELEDIYSSGARAAVIESGAGELDILHWLAGRVQPNLVLLAPPDVVERRNPPPEIGGLLISAVDRSPFAPAGRLALERGLPVRIAAHGNPDLAVSLALDLAASGVPETAISLSGLTHPEAASALAQCGAGVVLTVAHDAPDVAALAISQLAATSTWGERIAIGSGLSTRDDLLAFGGAYGLGWTMAAVPILLMEAGMDALAVRALFIDNPARMLTIAGETD